MLSNKQYEPEEKSIAAATITAVLVGVGASTGTVELIVKLINVA